MRHHHFGDGEYVVRLDPGDEVIASLVRFAEEERIRAGAVIGGIGSFERVTLGVLDEGGTDYVKRRFEEPMEVAALQGNLGVADDKPFAHLHVVVAPREMLAYAGHLFEAKVGLVAELFVRRLPGRLDRLPRPDSPLLQLTLPGEPPPAAEAEGEEEAEGR